jgi:hypothetical protein
MDEEPPLTIYSEYVPSPMERTLEAPNIMRDTAEFMSFIDVQQPAQI